MTRSLLKNILDKLLLRYLNRKYEESKNWEKVYDYRLLKDIRVEVYREPKFSMQYISKLIGLDDIGDDGEFREFVEQVSDMLTWFVDRLIVEEVKPLKCWDCGEEMEQKVVKTEAVWENNRYEVDGIAWVCPKCGGQFFDGEEAQRLREVGRLSYEWEKFSNKRQKS